MTDWDLGRARARDRERLSSRSLVFATMASALIVACARTQLEGPPWQNDLDPTLSAGGMLDSGGSPRAGSAAGGQSSSAGRTNASQLGGGPAVEPEGDGGEGGEDQSTHHLPTCDRAITMVLDGPLVQETVGLVDSAVSGDWNGDGKLDLVGANKDGSVSLLVGYGDGSFDSSAVFGSGLEVLLTQDDQTSIASSDLNADGRLDLVVGNRGASFVGVLLGTGSGTFGSGTTYAIEGNPRAIALSDFDGDGAVDIAAASNTGAVSVLLGNGNGTFGGKLVTLIGDGLKSIASADLNHDGHPDIVTVGDPEVAVLLGDGAGKFVKAQVYRGGYSKNAIEIADFDADGHADLAIGDTCSPSFYKDTRVSISLGHGDGTFSDGASYAMGRNCFERIAVADVNSDGAADVITSPVSALLGKGDGSFQPPLISSRANDGNLLGLGDWNGDGKVDVATASGHWVKVFLGSDDGSFGSNAVYAPIYTPRSLAVADLDRNGTLDIITEGTHQYHGGIGASAVSVQLGAGNGSFESAVEYEGAVHSDAVTPADLNGDDWPDLITLGNEWTAGEWSSSFGALLATGNGLFAQELVTSAGKNVGAFATGDMNNDGRTDIVAIHRDPETVTLLYGKGDGTFVLGAPWPLPTPAHDVVVFEANRDGKLDLGVIFETGIVGLFLGNGDGTFAPGRQYSAGGDHFGITAADLNGDGKTDIVTWGAESVSTFFGAGSGSFGRRRTYGASAGRLVVADVDENGTQDLVMTSAPGGMTILLGASDATFLCGTRYAPGSGLSGLGVGDLDGDGHLDVVAGSETGVYVFLNTSP